MSEVQNNEVERRRDDDCEEGNLVKEKDGTPRTVLT